MTSRTKLPYSAEHLPRAGTPQASNERTPESFDDTVAVDAVMPRHVIWELTRLCNGYCTHCRLDAGPNVSTSTELTTAESSALIDELATIDGLALTMTGGEPLLRRDWRLLVAHATSSGLDVRVHSNGAIIGRSVAGDLADFDVARVVIGLDSARAAEHDAYRRFPGLHRRAVRAIEELVRQGVPVAVRFTPTKLNWHQAEGVVALASALGAGAIHMAPYVPQGRGSPELMLDAGELDQVFAEWARLEDAYRGRIELAWHECCAGIPGLEPGLRRAVGCGAGWLVARICPDGAVTPCMHSPAIIGSCRRHSFRAMWSRSPLLAAFREQRGQLSAPCADCAHTMCNGCRALAAVYREPAAEVPGCFTPAPELRIAAV